MKRQGVNTSAVWENMKDLIIKTIIWYVYLLIFNFKMIKANHEGPDNVHKYIS